MRARRGTAWALAAVGVGVASCGSAKKTAAPEAIEYAELADRYNERVQHLDVVRGRGVVNFRWIDEQGDEQWEQGNLDVQVAQPSRVVFRVTKLGETLLWVGCDDERYWMIDLLRKKDTVAYVGRHDAMTEEKARSIGLVVPPRELVALMGLRGMPTVEGDAPEVQAVEEGWVVELPTGTGGQWVHVIEPVSARPIRVELADAQGEAVVRAQLDDYQVVDTTDKAQIVHMAMDVTIEYPAAGASMRIDLQSADDREPKSSAFDFEGLVEALRPSRVVDLDAEPAGGGS